MESSGTSAEMAGNNEELQSTETLQRSLSVLSLSKRVVRSPKPVPFSYFGLNVEHLPSPQHIMISSVNIK